MQICRVVLIQTDTSILSDMAETVKSRVVRIWSDLRIELRHCDLFLSILPVIISFLSASFPAMSPKYQDQLEADARKPCFNFQLREYWCIDPIHSPQLIPLGPYFEDINPFAVYGSQGLSLSSIEKTGEDKCAHIRYSSTAIHSCLSKFCATGTLHFRSFRFFDACSNNNSRYP